MEMNSVEMAVLPQNKIVSDAAIARRLLRDGYKVTDIKPKKGHPRESIFLFEVVPGFMEKMGEYIEEKRLKKQGE